MSSMREVWVRYPVPPLSKIIIINKQINLITPPRKAERTDKLFRPLSPTSPGAHAVAFQGCTALPAPYAVSGVCILLTLKKV